MRAAEGQTDTEAVALASDFVERVIVTVEAAKVQGENADGDGAGNALTESVKENKTKPIPA